MPTAAASRPAAMPLLALLTVFGVLIGGLAVSTPAAAAVTAADRGGVRLDKIGADLRAEMARAEPDDRLTVLVTLGARPHVAPQRFQTDRVRSSLRTTAERSQAPVLDTIRGHSDTVVNTFWLDNMVLAKVRPETLQDLAALTAADSIIPNFAVSLPRTLTEPNTPDQSPGAVTWGVHKIGADAVHSAFDVTGRGVRIAVLDSGVDIGHPDLAGKLVTDDPADPSFPGGWIEFSSSGEPVRSTPHDSDYHGTHVAGTAVGGNASGTQIGVAPGADLMAALILPGGNGTFAQVVAGMQWAVAPFDAAGNPAGEPADVVNMSLQAAGHFSQLIEPTRNLYLAGVFPSFAIGNNCGAVSGGPGNVYEAVGVGATGRDDGVADFSCGEVVQKSDWTDPPAQWPDTYVVPDLSAPGVGVYSSLPGGGYGLLDGTSMATPHVSGTVALMLEGRPSMSVDQVLQELVDTSFFDDRYGSQRPNPRYGWGRIDAYRAVAEVSFDGGIEGTITDAKRGRPIPGVEITRLDVGRSVETDQDGRYDLSLPAGTYDLRLSRFGYEPRTVRGVRVEDGRFTVLNHTLTPVRTGRITGRVTYGPTGSTVPGATARVVGVDADLSATTSSNGSYTIVGVPTGTYRVEAAAPGLPPSDAAHVSVTSGKVTRRADLSLPRPLPTSRVSVATDGTEGDGESLVPAVSADGRYVAYHSFASTLVAGDTNGAADVFVRDRRSGTTDRVSVASDGDQGNGSSVQPTVSASGRYVAFGSFASNLVDGDTNGVSDIYVRDRQAGKTERVSVAADGSDPNGFGSFVSSISADGRYVAFHSYASNLAGDDTNGVLDIYVRDRQSGSTERVSVRSDGGQANGGSFVASLSPDGRYVMFTSSATNLVDDDTNGFSDVFVHDLQTGTTELVSVSDSGGQSNGTSQGDTLSADGRYVAFYSSAGNLVDGDTNEASDVFVRDRQTGTTERVSLASDGGQGNAPSEGAALSADGRYVAFLSLASDLVEGDDNGRADVFVHDRQTGTTVRVSLAPDASQGDGPSQGVDMSADGGVVAFHSDASTLAVGDTNTVADVFVHDRNPRGPEAQFVPVKLTVRPDSVQSGDPVKVRVLVKNVGGVAGEYQAVLRVDGTAEQSQMVPLRPDRLSWVRFRIRPTDPGPHQVTVGPLTGTFTVTDRS